MSDNKQNVTFNLGVLDKLREHLTAGTYVKVGILGDDASRTGDDTLNNVELGVIHELGSVSRGIPARSWLRMPLFLKQKEIAAFAGSKKVMDLVLAGRVDAGLNLLGQYAESWIHSAFASSGFGTWAPNSPSTVKRKGSSKPLIDTRQMERAVSSEVVRP